MTGYGTRWSRDETLLVFGLYCELPFGRLHRGNPEIIKLASCLGRTPSSVAMKACNFASLDPVHKTRGVKGLANASRTEKEIWHAFFADSASLVDEISESRRRRDIIIEPTILEPAQLAEPNGPSETREMVLVRRHQRFFRQAVLTSYSTRCALTGLQLPSLLVASHIIPWSSSPQRRCDPTNGLCLNVLHDRAFDRGLITFSDDLELIPSRRLQDIEDLGLLESALSLGGQRLAMPERFRPDPVALAYHREHIFTN